MSHVDEGVLNAYLDGELPTAERAMLEAHLAECATCRSRLEEERVLSVRAGELLGLAQPPDVLPRRRSWRRVRMPLAWAASVILALAVGYAVHDAGSYGVAASPPPAQPPAADVAMTTDSLAASIEPKRYFQGNQQMQQQPTPQATRPRVDSFIDRPAAGVVAIQPPPAARASAKAVGPAPAPLPITLLERDDGGRAATDVAAGAASPSVSTLRGRMVATEWPIIRRGSARELLGSDPVGVPGLEVREIRRSPAADGTILVEQRLDSTTIIQLYQRPARGDEQAPAALGYANRERAAARRDLAVTDRLARYVGALRVEIAGPLSQDSLNRLLEQLKPLP